MSEFRLAIGIYQQFVIGFGEKKIEFMTAGPLIIVYHQVFVTIIGCF